jgi:hypothetical protein
MKIMELQVKESSGAEAQSCGGLLMSELKLRPPKEGTI